MEYLESISIGFDIATAASIIGAAAVFIFNTRKENRKKIGEERENERTKNLSSLLTEYREKHLFPFLECIHGGNKGEADPREIIFNIYEFLRGKALPATVIYSTKEDFNAIVEVIEETESIFNKTRDPSKDLDKSIQDYIAKLIQLERTMILRLRGLMHSESSSDSEKISKLYKKFLYKS